MLIDPLELHMPGLGKTWYATVDERNMFEWVNKAPLSTRAWAFHSPPGAFYEQLRQRSGEIPSKNMFLWHPYSHGHLFTGQSRGLFNGK